MEYQYTMLTTDTIDDVMEAVTAYVTKWLSTDRSDGLEITISQPPAKPKIINYRLVRGRAKVITREALRSGRYYQCVDGGTDKWKPGETMFMQNDYVYVYDSDSKWIEVEPIPETPAEPCRPVDGQYCGNCGLTWTIFSRR